MYFKKTNNTVFINTSKTRVGTTNNRNLYENENITDIENKSIKNKSIYTSTSHERIPENNNSTNSINKTMCINNIMNLTYNDKEIHIQNTINNTSTNINPNNTTQPTIIMNKVNEKSIYRKHIPNGKKQIF